MSLDKDAIEKDPTKLTEGHEEEDLDALKGSGTENMESANLDNDSKK
ncbi:hypothetical protein ACKQTC_06335 [Peptococcus simiae]|uniref:Uncharacterized protein n=1 Tax=Peptococcus simiae TaxID=1643805 RepID=A0ABW9GZD7_9FIRM